MTEGDPSAPSAAAHNALWRRAQALSGLLLAVFVAIHLVNLPLALFPGAYDAYQRILRTLYQSPFFEIPFVMLPLLVHLAAGVRAILAKERAKAATWPARLHRWSAWYLLLMVAGHAFATRGPSVFYGVYPEALGVSFALEWLPVFFWPYYLLLGISGVVHLGYGVPRALSVVRRHSDRSGSSRPLAAGILVFTLAVVLGIFGFSGLYYPIDDPFQTDYAAIYRESVDLPFMPEVPTSRATR